MGALSWRAAKLAAPISVAAITAFATPAFAETSGINAADTAWMIVATALVLMMTIPGLALFYSGMVRKKNVLATMAQSLSAVTIISILWVASNRVALSTFALAARNPCRRDHSRSRTTTKTSTIRRK